MFTLSAGVREVENIDDAAYRSLDKRGVQDPVPNNVEQYLTPLQRQSLDYLKEFGWRIAFVRRPLFELPTVVLVNNNDKQHAILEEEGTLNIEPQMQWRVV